jgi:hypothetical protein
MKDSTSLELKPGVVKTTAPPLKSGCGTLSENKPHWKGWNP